MPKETRNSGASNKEPKGRKSRESSGSSPLSDREKLKQIQEWNIGAANAQLQGGSRELAVFKRKWVGQKNPDFLKGDAPSTPEEFRIGSRDTEASKAEQEETRSTLIGGDAVAEVQLRMFFNTKKEVDGKSIGAASRIMDEKEIRAQRAQYREALLQNTLIKIWPDRSMDPYHLEQTPYAEAIYREIVGKSIPESLVYLRESHRLTRAELAERMNERRTWFPRKDFQNEASLANLEDGKRIPQEREVELILIGLGIDTGFRQEGYEICRTLEETVRKIQVKYKRWRS